MKHASVQLTRKTRIELVRLPNLRSRVFYKDIVVFRYEVFSRMPRPWLRWQTRRSAMKPTELTNMRSRNSTTEHPNFAPGETTDGAASHKRRLVSHDGKINVANTKVPRKRQRYFGDLFTTILDMPFPCVLGIYSVVHLVSWSGFGTIWFLIHHLRQNAGYDPFYCVDNVDSWISAFLFSIETQTTIGYGGRQVTPNCPEGVAVLLIQTLVGSFIAATLLGIVFAKASRPKKRSRTVLFSKKAVIGKRNDQLCLMFRVADIRASQLLECHIQMEMFYTKETDQGELPHFHQRLSIGNGMSKGEDYRTFLILPNTVAHVIDKNSPMYEMSSVDILIANVELVVFLQGVIESTGLTMQARTSYTGNEIVWGCDFAPLHRHDDLVFNEQLRVDLNYFDKLERVRNMPVCSARDHERLKSEQGSQSVITEVERDIGEYNSGHDKVDEDEKEDSGVHGGVDC